MNEVNEEELQKLKDMKVKLDKEIKDLLQEKNEENYKKLTKQLRFVFLIEFLQEYETAFTEENTVKGQTDLISKLHHYDSKFHTELINQLLEKYIKDDQLLLFLINWCITNKKIVILRTICLLVDPILLSSLLIKKNNSNSPFLFAIKQKRVRIVKLFSSFIKLTNIAFSQDFPSTYSDRLIEDQQSEIIYDDYYDPKKKYSETINYSNLLDFEKKSIIYKEYKKKTEPNRPSLFGGKKSKRNTKKINTKKTYKKRNTKRQM
jgi:hypothetical protein